MNNELKSDHILTVYVFLASATFTALFFLLQSNSPVKNRDFFVTCVAIASMLFIILVIARLNVSNGIIPSGKKYTELLGILSVIGFILVLLILVLLLILEINYLVGIIVGVFTFSFYIIIDIVARRSH